MERLWGDRSDRNKCSGVRGQKDTLAAEQSNQQPELNLVISDCFVPVALPTQATTVCSRVKEGNWHSHQMSDTGLGISKGLLKLRRKVTQKNLVRATAGPLSS